MFYHMEYREYVFADKPLLVSLGKCLASTANPFSALIQLADGAFANVAVSASGLSVAHFNSKAG